MAKKAEKTKLSALRKQGALNPHPERVKDALFEENEFFDPTDLVQVKYEMLRRTREEGSSISAAAQTFGFSRPSFYKARADFEAHGLPGLIPNKRGPTSAHKLTPKIMLFIRKLTEEEPALSTAALADRVGVQYGMRIHPRSIKRAMRREKKKLHPHPAAHGQRPKR